MGNEESQQQPGGGPGPRPNSRQASAGWECPGSRDPLNSNSSRPGRRAPWPRAPEGRVPPHTAAAAATEGSPARPPRPGRGAALGGTARPAARTVPAARRAAPAAATAADPAAAAAAAAAKAASDGRGVRPGFEQSVRGGKGQDPVRHGPSARHGRRLREA
ncbi:hypothetical protein CEXT_46151 [Caerostris extrusa]|uniref:Uncharacterized protein n=1 Tax=Caerostris extrusa TaxID=172846 RepID=A0AAV4PRD9_CAEEX|nr:hypothetical protein CEXT_46151 [Caerostris extrusa]